MLASVVTGVAIFATLASAQMASPGDSFARCSITGRGLAGSMSEEVGVEIVAIASDYVCGDVEAVSRTALVSAREIATATAFAIASASATCYAMGNARFQINGRSAANAEAFAIANSVVAAAVGVDVCGQCEVAAGLFARSFEAIYIEATAEAEIALSGASTPDAPVEARASAFQAQLVTATAEAIADVLLDIRGAVDEGCNATILADIGSEFNGATCAVQAAGSAESEESTSTAIAIAAGLTVAQKSCGVEIEETLTVLVSQVAEAMASALAEVSAACLIAGDAYACVVGEAEINATANATAFAFAGAFARETETCGTDFCTLRVAALARVVRTVLIRATSAVYFETCAGPDTFFAVNAFQETLISVIVAPLLEIVGQVTVISGRCSVSVPIFDVPEPPMMMMPPPPPMMMNQTIPTCEDTCAPDMRQCFGSGFDAPRACCSDDYICVRRDDDFSQCRLNGRPGTFVVWDGREEVCTPPM